MVVGRVETEIYGAAEDLAADAEGEPEAKEAALVVGFGVGESDGGFGHPEYAGADPAQRGADQNEPFRAEPVVGVETGGEGRVAHSSKYQRPFYPDITQ